MVFSRKPDAALASLAKQLDQAVAQHASKDLRVFINLVGDNREALEAAATKFAADNQISNLPIVVPVEFENGPGNFGVNPAAETTVMLYVSQTVKANHAFAPGEFNDAAVKAVVEDLPKILD